MEKKYEATCVGFGARIEAEVVTPRPYQLEAVDRAFADWKRGCRSTLFICPTGGGKSLVFSLVARHHRQDGGRRVLVLADREWLVTQARDNIVQHAGLSSGIEMADEKVDRERLPEVVCASVQSLVRRLRDFPPKTFDLIVFDEADLALAPSYRKIATRFGMARILGVTATPERHDGVALKEMFESVCLDVDIRDLIDAGYLCNVRQWPVKVLDLSRVKIADGDFDGPLLDKILCEERHLHEVVRPTMDLSGDRPTLIFGTSVLHAQALAALFNRYRPGSARSIHGKTPRAARREILGAFVRREFQYLCNCMLIGRGVDVPEIACVAMARPTFSRTVYVQGLGRGFRMSANKADCLVIDFTDNSDNFSLVSAIDVLGGRSTPEARERARQIVEEEPGERVTDALDRAARELEADATMRARVRASVRFKKREMQFREPIDWKALPLGRVSDQEIAEKVGTNAATVACARHRLGIKMTGAGDGAAA